MALHQSVVPGRAVPALLGDGEWRTLSGRSGPQKGAGWVGPAVCILTSPPGDSGAHYVWEPRLYRVKSKHVRIAFQASSLHHTPTSSSVSHLAPAKHRRLFLNCLVHLCTGTHHPHPPDQPRGNKSHSTLLSQLRYSPRKAFPHLCSGATTESWTRHSRCITKLHSDSCASACLIRLWSPEGRDSVIHCTAVPAQSGCVCWMTEDLLLVTQISSRAHSPPTRGP